MSKRWIAGAACVLLMTVLTCTAAAADTLDILKPVWLHALENMQEEADSPIAEPAVISGDAQFEVVRSAVYMNDEYDTEAYVYAELRNTGESVVRMNGAQLTVLDAGGRQVSKREYASVKPDVVMPGESVFIAEWFYDFASSLSRVNVIKVTFERSSYSRKKIERLAEARAYIDGNYLYAEVTNTTDRPLFEIGVTAVVMNAQGKILDMLREETYSNMGIAPGSTLILRKGLEKHALDIPDALSEAAGYVYGE